MEARGGIGGIQASDRHVREELGGGTVQEEIISEETGSWIQPNGTEATWKEKLGASCGGVKEKLIL